MNACRICGREIEDGEELCEECKVLEAATAQSADNNSKAQSQDGAESVSDSSENEDVMVLLDLLEKDYLEDSFEEEDLIEDDTEAPDPNAMDAPIDAEASLFVDDDGSIFSDGKDVEGETSQAAEDAEVTEDAEATEDAEDDMVGDAADADDESDAGEEDALEELDSDDEEAADGDIDIEQLLEGSEETPDADSEEDSSDSMIPEDILSELELESDEQTSSDEQEDSQDDTEDESSDAAIDELLAAVSESADSEDASDGGDASFGDLSQDEIDMLLNQGTLDETAEDNADTVDESAETEAEATTVDDIFQDALAAVEYSEREEDDIDEEDFFALDEQIPEADEEKGPDEEKASDQEDKPVELTKLAKPKKKKKEKVPKDKTKKGLFSKLFSNIVTEETAEIEARERAEAEAAEVDKKVEKEKKKQEAEALKEEKARIAEEEKTQKEALKAEKAAKKAAEKEEKKRKKEEEEANEVVGKINPVGAFIVLVFFGLICASVLIGTSVFSGSTSLKKAKTQFDAGAYEKAYEAMNGVTDDDEETKELKEKIRICMKMQKEINSYTNYYKMGMYLESLDSLLKGIRNYDVNKDRAYNLKILDRLDGLKQQIIKYLQEEYSLTEGQARVLNATEGQEAYTRRLEEIIDKWSQNNKADEK